MSYENFCRHQNVPRGTFSKLEEYVEILLHWQKAINLISSETQNMIWERHILDSAQLYPYVNGQLPLIDIGTGAGFPGMVLAILGIENTSLVESDGRKITFLRELARKLSVSVQIIHDRVEHVSFSNDALIVSRAFAPLEHIFSCLEKKLTPTNSMLLLKGKSADKELAEAQKKWSFSLQKYPSKTHPEGVILSITHPLKEVSHATH